ncbi:MAG: hypothetical protein U5K00_08145 [Melioribacteraceae bacterium]|nr:hypothetical protein [Melioribacteraceae bacterium]
MGNETRQDGVGFVKAVTRPNFVEVSLLTADLVNLQYDEMRREFVYWTKKLTGTGIILIDWNLTGNIIPDPVLEQGRDELPEDMMYKALGITEEEDFGHGAIMMGADYTQWHGVWELGEDLIRNDNLGSRTWRR